MYILLISELMSKIENYSKYSGSWVSFWFDLKYVLLTVWAEFVVLSLAKEIVDRAIEIIKEESMYVFTNSLTIEYDRI